MNESFFNRKKVISSITINMLYLMTGLSNGIIFRIINDREFLTELAGLILKHSDKHRRKSQGKD